MDLQPRDFEVVDDPWRASAVVHRDVVIYRQMEMVFTHKVSGEVISIWWRDAGGSWVVVRVRCGERRCSIATARKRLGAHRSRPGRALVGVGFPEASRKFATSALPHRWVISGPGWDAGAVSVCCWNPETQTSVKASWVDTGKRWRSSVEYRRDDWPVRVISMAEALRQVRL